MRAYNLRAVLRFYLHLCGIGEALLLVGGSRRKGWIDRLLNVCKPLKLWQLVGGVLIWNCRLLAGGLCAQVALSACGWNQILSGLKFNFATGLLAVLSQSLSDRWLRLFGGVCLVGLHHARNSGILIPLIHSHIHCYVLAIDYFQILLHLVIFVGIFEEIWNDKIRRLRLNLVDVFVVVREELRDRSELCILHLLYIFVVLKAVAQLEDALVSLHILKYADGDVGLLWKIIKGRDSMKDLDEAVDGFMLKPFEN